MRHHSFLPSLLFCVALAGSALAAPRPAGMGTVGGRVLNAKGKPVANARVTLQDSGGGHLQTTETNTQGHFWFAFLPEGEYDVRAYYHGDVSEWRQNVWVSPGKQTNAILHLHPKKSRPGNARRSRQ
jgi:Carboxypeptidase regulatory-like domain